MIMVDPKILNLIHIHSVCLGTELAVKKKSSYDHSFMCVSEAVCAHSTNGRKTGATWTVVFDKMLTAVVVSVYCDDCQCLLECDQK
jgi:hypothetical protein